MKFISITRYLGTFGVAACLCSFAPVAGAADKISCTFSFEAEAGRNHGTAERGSTLRGRLTFVAQGGERVGDTVHYKADGKLRVSAKGQGEIVGDVWDVHVTRSPAVADLISIGVRDLEGNLGQQTRYMGPTLITLYGKRGQLGTHDLPTSAASWNALELKRVFQFHSPTALNVALNDVGPFEGACKKES
ncbi:MAG: hypothetical protein MPJ78_19745 [Hyphomicrobiaceae bacterium]|nr:hypothetical protein [Hyphomicrobiaceae bacterium]